MENCWPYRNDEKRLVTEQAVLDYRKLRAGMKDAPHGKGMARMFWALCKKKRLTPLNCTRGND